MIISRLLWPGLADTSQPSLPRFARFAALGLLLATAVWSLVSAVGQKNFHWRGGRPMPTWLGRSMSILLGLFLIWAVFTFWNR
jgi:hypothetical protein